MIGSPIAEVEYDEWRQDDRPYTGNYGGPAMMWRDWDGVPYFLKDGEIEGMLSVHGSSGDVWYHSWHGDFVAMAGEHE